MTSSRKKTKAEREKSSQLMKISDIQYWHEVLNKMFFSGELEPALIKVWRGTGTAEFFSAAIPSHIIFYESFDIENKDPIFVLTVLLHEMVHQYCFEKGLKDEDTSIEIENYNPHDEIFIREAKKHGLINKGRNLSKKAELKIKKELELFLATLNNEFYCRYG